MAGCGNSTPSTTASCATQNPPLTGLITQNMELTVTPCNEWHVTAPGVEFEGATLTVDPGVTVVFDADTYLEVGLTQSATLLANGTASSPVIFTSSATTPAAGDWSGLVFGPSAGSNSRLNYVTVSDAGSVSSSTNGITYPGAIVAYGDSSDLVSVELTNLSVIHSASSGIVFAGPYAGMTSGQGAIVGMAGGSGNLTVESWAANGYPIVIDANQASTVPSSITIGSSTNSGGSYDNNVVALACQAVADCGDPMIVTSSQQWKVLPVNYQVVTTSGVDVENGQLTIDPGTTIEFADDSAFSVNNLAGGGSLSANGSATEPIIFTSRDTNSSTADATWQGIKLVFDTGVTGWVLNFCEVSNALGYEVAQEGNEYAGSIVVGDVGDSGITSMPVITNCTITYPLSNSTLPLPASPACGILTLGLDFGTVGIMYGTGASGQSGNAFTPSTSDVCSI
jgi:plastocyanin